MDSQPEPPTLFRTSVTPAFSNFLGNALKVLISLKPHGMGDPQVVLHIPAQTQVKRLNPQEAAFMFKFLSEVLSPVLIMGEHQGLSQITQGLWHLSWKHQASGHSSGWGAKLPEVIPEAIPPPQLCIRTLWIWGSPGKTILVILSHSVLCLWLLSSSKLKVFIPMGDFPLSARPQLRFL